MADAPKKKLPPEFAARATKLTAAYDAFLVELGALKKEKKTLAEKILKRVETGKMEEIKKFIDGI